jgi:hypothetical protein
VLPKVNIRFIYSLVRLRKQILISFVMVLQTVDTQFGIVWPAQFVKVLSVMSLLSFDCSAIASTFQIVKWDFYESLLCQTVTLSIVVFGIMAASKYRGKQLDDISVEKRGRFIAVYLVLFAFPVVSMNLVDAFACQEVLGGRHFLRRDYSIECSTSRYHVMAAYAGVLVVLYVVIFPMLLFKKLWGYHKQLEMSQLEMLRPKTKMVLVSLPEYGLDDSGGYTFPVMETAIALAKREESVILGSEFAGSANKVAEDAPLWEDYKQASSFEEKAIAVRRMRWFSAYSQYAAGITRSACQEGFHVVMVCIAGGPVTQIKAQEIPLIRERVIAGLSRMLYTDVVIDIQYFDTYQDLESFVEEHAESSLEPVVSVANLRYGFLLEDFKLAMPMLLWEWVELIRKLCLAVVGAFWSTKGTLCVAAALFISAFFSAVHLSNYPYKSISCNRLQALCLSVLTTIYFIGLCLQLRHNEIDSSERRDFGDFLVFLVALTFASFCALVFYEIRAATAWVMELKHVKTETIVAPTFDPSLQYHIIDANKLALGKILGQGAEGVVRQGEYEGQQVAVKVEKMVAQRAFGETVADALNILQAEAQTLVSLRHPSIVLFHGISFEVVSIEVRVMTVLELCPRAVNDYIYDESAEISWLEKVVLCERIAQGLAYLHQKGVLHRDREYMRGMIVSR